jgi:uroporphyrin-III C-methyltransferase/precorrin-2 dehydrogenase/sirohydrochlorin ferrochelatase
VRDEAATPKLYPLFLMLEGRRVLVIGAGTVAERKIVDLVAAGARVRVVSPEGTAAVAELAENGAITWERRAFAESDVDDAWLVVASTDDRDVQRRASDAAEGRRAFCVAVDDLPNGSAYSAAVVRRAPFTVAISSSGEAPALARLLRELIEQILPDAEWVAVARALREKWRAEGTPTSSRFAELVRAFKERD